METENKSNHAVPLAILLAGVLIAGALYLRPASAPIPTAPSGQAAAVGVALAKLSPIDAGEHQRGPAEAALKIVEFSDLECPFCKAFQRAMQKLIAKYPDDVAWIYRHFPLDELHSKARAEAVAAECVAQLADEDLFWPFVDKIFEVTPSNNGLDPALLPQLAEELGLDRAEFEKCLSSEPPKAAVNADYEDGVAIRVDGTPFVVAIGPEDKKVLVFREATPSDWDESLKTILDELEQLYQAEIQILRAGN